MKFCIHCGAPLKESSKFCTSCGSAVAPQQAEQSAPEVPKEPVKPEPVQQPAPKTAKAPGKLTSLMKKHPVRSAVCIVLAVVILMAVYLFYPRLPVLKYDGATLRYGQVVSADYLGELFDEKEAEYFGHTFSEGVHLFYWYSDVYDSCTINGYYITDNSEGASIGGIHVGDSAESVVKKYWNAKQVTNDQDREEIRILLNQNGCPVIYSERGWETNVVYYMLTVLLDEDGCVEYIHFS